MQFKYCKDRMSLVPLTINFFFLSTGDILSRPILTDIKTAVPPPPAQHGAPIPAAPTAQPTVAAIHAATSPNN